VRLRAARKRLANSSTNRPVMQPRQPRSRALAGLQVVDDEPERDVDDRHDGHRQFPRHFVRDEPGVEGVAAGARRASWVRGGASWAGGARRRGRDACVGDGWSLGHKVPPVTSGGTRPHSTPGGSAAAALCYAALRRPGLWVQVLDPCRRQES